MERKRKRNTLVRKAEEYEERWYAENPSIGIRSPILGLFYRHSKR